MKRECESRDLGEVVVDNLVSYSGVCATLGWSQRVVVSCSPEEEKNSYFFRRFVSQLPFFIDLGALLVAYSTVGFSDSIGLKFCPKRVEIDDVAKNRNRSSFASLPSPLLLYSSDNLALIQKHYQR